MVAFEQRPWTPTKRRGPIAAELHSPGPACVQLPQLLGNKKYKTIDMCFIFIETQMSINCVGVS